MANELESQGIQDADLSPVLGTPAMPPHSKPVHICYSITAICLGITSGIASDLASTNISAIGGDYGMYSDQATWYLIAYLAGNGTSNMLWIKLRQNFNGNFGSPAMIVMFAVVTALQLVFQQNFIAQCILRYFLGLFATGLATVTVFYMLQGLWGKLARPNALIVGISLTQLAGPIAHIVSPTLFESGMVEPFLYFQLALALLCVTLVLIFPLPPSLQRRVYEASDFITYLVFFAPAYTLFVAAMSLGKTVWWDTHWLWVALAASLVLGIGGMVFEYYRKTPSFVMGFLFAPEMIMFVLACIGMRFLLCEQSVGASGFLSAVGMGIDQMVGYGWVTLAGTVAGIFLLLALYRPNNQMLPIFVATAMIAIAGIVDAHSSPVSRPHNFYFTQFFVSVATILFFSSLFISGIMRMLLAGADAIFINWVMIFAGAQGGAATLASAFFGTFQIVRKDFHTQVLADQMSATRPEVAAQLASSAAGSASTQTDPALRAYVAGSDLGDTISKQANILAYNDVFIAIGVLSAAAAIMTLAYVLTMKLRNEKGPMQILVDKLQAMAQKAPEPKTASSAPQQKPG